MSSDGRRRHRTLDRYVLDSEELVIATHRHWGRVLEPVASAIAGLIIAGALSATVTTSSGPLVELPAIAVFALAVRACWAVLQWRHEWFVATDKRLLLIYGLVTHRVAMMPMGKVTDMNYLRSPIGQIVGYGTFILESAGQDQALHRITWVPHPDQTYRRICDSLFTPGSAPADDPPDDATDHDALHENPRTAQLGSLAASSPTQPIRVPGPVPPPPPLPPSIAPRATNRSASDLSDDALAVDALATDGPAWAVSTETGATFVTVEPLGGDDPVHSDGRHRRSPDL